MHASSNEKIKKSEIRILQYKADIHKKPNHTQNLQGYQDDPLALVKYHLPDQSLYYD